jgi:hypothetical protein
VIVHEHCGESGAIAAALESWRLCKLGHGTKFIGLEAVEKISYLTQRNENTHCYFCKNKCMRTFIDVRIASADESQKKTKIRIAAHPKPRIAELLPDHWKTAAPATPTS